ncbi:MAG: hypothetical protein HY899_02560 [Deltaproteobacteria bacterium]|nr:hypothetical protein [Deltaproteobacteria bacterium]
MDRSRFLPRLFGVALVLSVIGGCATLPDVGPFTGATGDLRTAVVSSGAVVDTELRMMSGAAGRADLFALQWQNRVRALDAVAEYSASLAAIVDAGNHGKESATKLADAIKGLAQTAGIAVPAAGAVPIVVDAATMIYGQIAVVRGAHSLEEALDASQPAIAQIGTVIAKDLRDARDIWLSAGAEVRAKIQTDQQIGLAFREELIAARDRLYAKSFEDLTAEQRRQLAEVDGQIAATDRWYVPMTTELQRADERFQAGTRLLATGADAVTTWARAHEQLIDAVKTRRPVTAQSVALAAVQVRDLARRIQEL